MTLKYYTIGHQVNYSSVICNNYSLCLEVIQHNSLISERVRSLYELMAQLQTMHILMSPRGRKFFNTN